MFIMGHQIILMETLINIFKILLIIKTIPNNNKTPSEEMHYSYLTQIYKKVEKLIRMKLGLFLWSVSAGEMVIRHGSFSR